jgi:hypothetical protein
MELSGGCSAGAATGSGWKPASVRQMNMRLEALHVGATLPCRRPAVKPRQAASGTALAPDWVIGCNKSGAGYGHPAPGPKLSQAVASGTGAGRWTTSYKAMRPTNLRP